MDIPVTLVAEVAVNKLSVKFVHWPSFEETGRHSKNVPVNITAKRLIISVLAGFGCFAFFVIIGIFTSFLFIY